MFPACNDSLWVEPSASRPRLSPDVRPTHNRVPAESAYSRLLAEAIAAPQVSYRHCHASFPFPGATNGGTLSGAGQSGPRDPCPHRGSRPRSNRFPRNACSTRLTRLSAAPNFHARWCAARRMRSGPEQNNSKIQVLYLVSLRRRETILALPQLYRSCTEPDRYLVYSSCFNVAAKLGQPPTPSPALRAGPFSSRILI
jgi:hypothetical protein